MISSHLSINMSSASSSRQTHHNNQKRASTSTVRPPQWQAPWHRTADLGYPDFHPPRPGQEEDSMADAVVKGGYVGKPIVQTDSFTVHEMIYDSWEKHDQTVVRQLGDIMSEVAARRERRIPSIGPSTFRLPDRRTLPPPKTQAWIANLANPDVPLTELNKVMPHTPKGVDLLEMLETHKVSIPRAVWLVRVVGAADTQNMARSRSGFKPSQYSIEWAGAVTSYMKKQLKEIVLPRPQMAQTSSLKSTFKSVLSDPETRTKWLQKFTYTISLLREFYAEGLVDHATFLFWLAQQVGESNIPQLGFIAKLADEYIEDLLKHRGFLRPFIVGLVEKLVEVARIPQAERGVVAQLSQTLGSLLQQTFVGFPDAFVFPRVWKDRTNQRLLHHLLVKGPNEIVQAPPDSRRAQEIFEEMRVNFQLVEKRNNALLFTSLPPRDTFSMRLTMADIQLLNSIGPDTHLGFIKFFDPASTLSNTAEETLPSPSSSFDTKLNILLTWAVVSSQYGDHRPFAAAALLSLFKDEAKLRAMRRKLPKPDGLLQEKLFKWLDTSDVARDHHNNSEGVVLLYGELCRRALMSYPWFIQRLMARGEAGSKDQSGGKSHLLTILEGLPLPSPSLANERKAALYGVSELDRSRPSASEKNLRQEIKAAFPALWGGEAQSRSHPSFPHLLKSTRFEQHSVITHWLLPTVLQLIEKRAVDPEESRLNDETFATLMEVMRITKSYPAILDLSLRILRDSVNATEIEQVTDCFLRHANIWASMDALGPICELLFETQQRLQIMQIDSRRLLAILDRHCIPHLSVESKRQVQVEAQGYAQTIPPPTTQTSLLPPIIQEIVDLPEAQAPDAVSSLAGSLWLRYGGQALLGSVIWDNTVQGVRKAGKADVDTAIRQHTILVYTAFLQETQKYFSFDNTLDMQVQHWFRNGNGREESSEFDSVTWAVMTPFLLQLVLKGCLTASTLLENVAYVAWKMSATLDRALEQTETFLKAANVLAERLLLTNAPPSEISEDEIDVPPLTLTQVQSFQTQRQRVYSGPAIKSLYKALRHLVSLEINTNLSEDVRQESQIIREALCCQTEFRTTAFRHLAELKDVFVRPLTTEKDVRLADVLRQIIHMEQADVPESSTGEPASQWQAIFSQLNAWGFSRASIELRLTLERMGSGLESSDVAAKNKAMSDIDGFMTGLFARDMDAEETDLTADVLTGIGGAVAARFLNHGIKRLTTLLVDLTKSPLTLDSTSSFIDTSGEVLRLLVSVLIPPPPSEEWAPEWVPSTFAQDAIEGFFRGICKAFGSVEQAVKDSTKRDQSGPTMSVAGTGKFVELTVLLCRMLHLMLRFDGIWTARVKANAEGLISLLLTIAVAYGGALEPIPNLFDILVKTASYVIDEVPKDIKTPDIDLMRQVPGIKPQSLPTRISIEDRETLKHLLGFVFEDPLAVNLVQFMETDGGEDGQVQLGAKVQSRPWEWLDHLEEPRAASSAEDEIMRIRNDTSISLEHFQARVVTNDQRIEASDGAGETMKRYTKDRLYMETMYERDWKETRVGTLATGVGNPTRTRSCTADDEQSSDDEDQHRNQPQGRHGGHQDPSAMSMEDARSSLASRSGMSPAPTRASSASRGTVEVIDVDALPGPEPGANTRGRKRKNTLDATAEGSDDEIQIIEPTSAMTSNSKGKGRGKGKTTSARGKGKKKA
ncbi:RNA polymerase II mediator complex subunit [Tulasnella sp. JGI-2019a]|nr:RNA polymerase II mediator complex subunit [Tulasnella sp. JGI-2019a]